MPCQVPSLSSQTASPSLPYQKRVANDGDGSANARVGATVVAQDAPGSALLPWAARVKKRRNPPTIASLERLMVASLHIREFTPAWPARTTAQVQTREPPATARCPSKQEGRH